MSQQPAGHRFAAEGNIMRAHRETVPQPRSVDEPVRALWSALG